MFDVRSGGVPLSIFKVKRKIDNLSSKHQEPIVEYWTKIQTSKAERRPNEHQTSKLFAIFND